MPPKAAGVVNRVNLSDDGTVTAVPQDRLDTLTAEQAHQRAGTDMQCFGHQLRENYYPDIPDDAVAEVAELATRPSR